MHDRPRVLVADDTTLVRWAVRRALDAAGYQVVDTGTRSQVLVALVSGSFSLVILSLALVGDGIEDIASAIASAAGNTSLIVLTDNGTIPAALRSRSHVKMLDKPFSVTSLVDLAISLVPVRVEPARDPVTF